MNQNIIDPANEDKTIQAALAYIHEHYEEDLSLSEVAEYVSLSPAYFSTRFAQCTGMNFSAYLRALRLEEARSLLTEEDSAVHEIAAQVGYRSTAYFIRSFVLAFGVTPGVYRRSCTAGNSLS